MAVTRTRIVVASALLVLIVGGLTWQLTRTRWHDGEFSSCTTDGRSLVLSYGYGAADDVRTTYEHGRVRLQTRTNDGPAPAIALYGEFRLTDFAGATSVREHSGRTIRCRAAIQLR
jgi:hypothetical protein